MSAANAAEMAELTLLVARVEELVARVQARVATPAPEATRTLDERTVMRTDLMRRPRAPLPDPRLLRTIIRQRRLRERYFESELFADPAWDMLLDLAAARAEHRRVSVTSLCSAAAVPQTTALRWITQMTQMGLVESQVDDADKRRRFVSLTANAASSVALYFDEMGAGTKVI